MRCPSCFLAWCRDEVLNFTTVRDEGSAADRSLRTSGTLEAVTFTRPAKAVAGFSIAALGCDTAERRTQMGRRIYSACHRGWYAKYCIPAHGAVEHMV